MSATFTHSEVCEVFGISAADLNSVIYNRSLLLASDQPGPFVARKFFTVDLYLIAIAIDLMNLTRRGADACRCVEWISWFDKLAAEDAIRTHRGLPKLTADERLRMRDELRVAACIEPMAIHPALLHRDLKEPFLIVAEEEFGKMDARIIPHSALWFEGVTGVRAMWIINLTRALADVDHNIALLRADA